MIKSYLKMLAFVILWGCTAPVILTDSAPPPADPIAEKVREKLAVLNADPQLTKRNIKLDVAHILSLPYGKTQQARAKIVSEDLKQAADTRWELDSFYYLIDDANSTPHAPCDNLGNFVCENQVPGVAVQANATGPKALKSAKKALQELEIAKKWKTQGKTPAPLVARFDARVSNGIRETWYIIFGLQPDTVEERAMVAVDATDFHILWTSPKQ